MTRPFASSTTRVARSGGCSQTSATPSIPASSWSAAISAWPANRSSSGSARPSTGTRCPQPPAPSPSTQGALGERAALIGGADARDQRNRTASIGPAPCAADLTMRDGGRTRVVEVLRTQGVASRADLVRATGLSRARVSAVVAALQGQGLVVEEPASPDRGAGKRTAPELLRFNSSARAMLGIAFDRGQCSRGSR